MFSQKKSTFSLSRAALSCASVIKSFDESMPVPGRHVEAVPLAPRQVSFRRSAFANLGNSPSANHVVDRIASVTMASRLRAGTEQLNPAAQRRRCRTAVLRIAILQNSTIEWIPRTRRR